MTCGFILAMHLNCPSLSAQSPVTFSVPIISPSTFIVSVGLTVSVTLALILNCSFISVMPISLASIIVIFCISGGFASQIILYFSLVITLPASSLLGLPL